MLAACNAAAALRCFCLALQKHSGNSGTPENEHWRGFPGGCYSGTHSGKFGTKVWNGGAARHAGLHDGGDDGGLLGSVQLGKHIAQRPAGHESIGGGGQCLTRPAFSLGGYRSARD